MLFRYAGDHEIPLYALIDEYDNFVNTVLTYDGVEAYHSFTHGGGFFRSLTLRRWVRRPKTFAGAFPVKGFSDMESPATT